MSTFYRYTNNGTVGVISEDTYKQIEIWMSLVDEARVVQPYPTPIFTFIESEHYETHYRQFVTGDLDLMDTLLKGHRVINGSSHYVPFSNYHELRGGEQAEQELRFRTTLEEAIEAFGLVVEEMREPVIS